MQSRFLSRTPCSVRARFKGSDADSSDCVLYNQFRPTAQQLQLFSEICAKTWQMYLVSPLYGLRLQNGRLREYSATLHSHLLADNQILPLVVQLTALSDFGTSGSKALQITVDSASPHMANTRLLTAVLCSPGREEEVSEGFTYLPVLLVRGPTAMASQLLGWLQHSFDCFISTLLPSLNQLSAILFHSICSDPMVEGHTEAVFSLPEHVQKAGLSTMSVQLPSHMLKEIRSRTKALPVDEQRKAPLDFIITHIRDNFHFKDKHLTLTQLTTPTCHINNMGKVKFLSVDHLIPLLVLLASK